MEQPYFHLFAYGTLRSADASGAARALLSRCERVGEGEIRGTLYDLGEYPALLPSGDDRVPGTIWRCPTDLLPELDRYEGTAERLFRRIGVRAGDRACWVYVAGPKLGPRLTPSARVTKP